MDVDSLNRICRTTHSEKEWKEFLYPTKKDDDTKMTTEEKDMIIVLLGEISKALQERNEIEIRKAKALEAIAESHNPTGFSSEYED